MEGDTGAWNFSAEFAKQGAWPESMLKGGASGAFNRTAMDSRHYSSASILGNVPVKHALQQGREVGGASYTKAV